MELYEYMILSEHLQWDILWDKGVFLEHHIGDDVKYSLYALGKFFVEVEFEPETMKIIGKVVFKYGAILDKYIQNYRIPV